MSMVVPTLLDNLPPARETPTDHLGSEKLLLSRIVVREPQGMQPEIQLDSERAFIRAAIYHEVLYEENRSRNTDPGSGDLSARLTPEMLAKLTAEEVDVIKRLAGTSNSDPKGVRWTDLKSCLAELEQVKRLTRENYGEKKRGFKGGRIGCPIIALPRVCKTTKAKE